MEFWIPLLGSALGGAVITGIFGFVKLQQDKNIEHARWLRNEKVETYSQYLENIRFGDILLTSVITGAATIQEVNEFKDHIGGFRLRLISPLDVRKTNDAYRKRRSEITDFLDHAPLPFPLPAEYTAAVAALETDRNNLAEAMAKDLKVTR